MAPLLGELEEIGPSQWLLSKGGDIARTRERFTGRKQSDKRELVRQWVARQLVTRYGYPDTWLGTRIVPVSRPKASAEGPAFFGLRVLCDSGQPFMWIATAPPGKDHEALGHARDALDFGGFAGIGVSTDGTTGGTKFMRRSFAGGECTFVSDLEAHSPASGLIGSAPLVASGANGDGLEPLSENIEDILFEAHSIVRDIDGLHADAALDELCKVLRAKIGDEQHTKAGQPFALQRALYGSCEELAAAVRARYADIATAGDDSGLTLSSPALARLVECLQGFAILRSTADVKGRAFQRVISPAIRAGMGQYFTPEEIIRFMVEVAAPAAGESFLDPFAGSARFVSEAVDYVDGSEPRSKLEGTFVGIEKNGRMARVAATHMSLMGKSQIAISHSDSLVAFENFSDLQRESFDVVLTNPPFGSVLGREAVARLGEFELASGRATVPLEILGLERCLQFLKPGGRLGIVLPEGVLTNHKSKRVRTWLQERAKIRAIVSLPIETFCPMGANVKTSIVFLRRWRRGEAPTLDYPVSLVRVDDVGHDASGRKTRNSELTAAAECVVEFLAEQGW